MHRPYKNLLLKTLLAVSILSPMLAEAATYYVSNSGAASWPSCTNILTPCTVTTAMSNAMAGDIVYFRGGTYEPGAGRSYEDPAWSPAHSGTSGNEIVFMAYPGETVTVLDASNSTTSTNPSFGTKNVNYIIWDGFTCIRDKVRSGASQMVAIGSSNHITIRNMTFSGPTNYSEGQNNAFIMMQSQADHIYIYNNSFTGYRATSGQLANTAAIWMMDDINHIYIYRNTFSGVNGGVWWKTGPENDIHIYQNFFSDIRSIGVKQHSSLGAGSEYSPRSSVFYIHHNVFYNAAVAVASIDGTGNAGWRSEDLRVYNNTAYWTTAPPSTGGFLQHGTSSYQTNLNTQIYNNIVYMTTAGRFLETWDSINTSNRPAMLDYNDYYNAAGTTSGTFMDSCTTVSGLTNWRARLTTTESWNITARETNSINSNPLFVNAGGSRPEDYMLTAGSPARGAGQGGVDLGAYSAPSIAIGYSPSPNDLPSTPPSDTTTPTTNLTPPPPPSNVRIQ